jgi:hypothetical protein
MKNMGKKVSHMRDMKMRESNNIYQRINHTRMEEMRSIHQRTDRIRIG